MISSADIACAAWVLDEPLVWHASKEVNCIGTAADGRALSKTQPSHLPDINLLHTVQDFTIQLHSL